MKKVIYILFILFVILSCSKKEEAIVSSDSCPSQDLGITIQNKNPFFPLVSDSQVQYDDWTRTSSGNMLTVIKTAHQSGLCGTIYQTFYSFKKDGKCLIPQNMTFFSDGEHVPGYVEPSYPITSLIIQEYTPNVRLVCLVKTITGVDTQGNNIVISDKIWVDLN